MKKISLGLLLTFVLMLITPVSVGAQDTSYVVDTTIAVNTDIRSAVDAWLAVSAPIPMPYWAITYVQPDGLDTFVSLVALDLVNPTDAWHITDSDTALWMGSVVVHVDDSVELYSDGYDQQAGASKLAAFRNAPGGGSNISFPWQAGGTMMYGERGVHDAGGGSYADGMSAVDFVGGDDMGSGVASNRIYAVELGTVDYVCEDDTTTLVRTTNAPTTDTFIYAHLLTNANLIIDHVFSKGSLIGSVKYGTFNDTCGYADQTPKHYHLHFGFTPANNSFRMENCILNTTTQKWTCGTQTVSTGQFLKGGGGLFRAGDDTGMGVQQPAFWDYLMAGAMEIWTKAVIVWFPTHNALKYTYVIYSTIKLMLRILWVMVYGNLNLFWFVGVLMAAISFKILLSALELGFFLLKAYNSIFPKAPGVG